VLGAGDRRRNFNAILTDVARSPHVDCVCDAHDIPFPDGSFDAVFAESILEHVCDPQRCADEIRRVLTDDGYVFANTPFLQPVHMGAYDFTRFTRLGHRRLFRYFDEVASGMSGGPAYTATHLTRNLITNLSDQPKTRRYLKLAALLASFPLRYLDPLLSRTESANNAACGFYFLGRKRSSPIPDRDIIDLFRGA
jgi:SAM-dependent methyltransferase